MKKSDTIAITSVKIEIAGTTLNLTIEQARQLKDILAQAFPEQKIVYVPTAPVIIERERWPDWNRPFWATEITCGGNTDTAGTLMLCAR